MPHDPLLTLMRLREAALDDTRRLLGEALAEEGQAQAALRDIRQAIAEETRIAAESPDDHDVERFACWLKKGRERMRRAEQATDDAAAATAARRAEVNLARASVEAVAGALNRARAQKSLAQERHLQREQDETGQRRAANRCA